MRIPTTTEALSFLLNFRKDDDKMKKNFTIRLTALMITLSLAAMSLLTLTGCSDSTGRPTLPDGQTLHLAIVISPTSQAHQVNLRLLEDDVYLACRSFGSVTLVVEDGAPYFRVIPIKAQPANLSENKYKSIAESQTKQILNAASSLRAKSEETDTLASVQTAARELKSHSDEPNVLLKLIVMSPSLPTTGVLNFTKTSLKSSPDKVVEQLRKAEELPDLTGIEVEAYNIGDVSGIQPDLGNSNRKNLREILKSIYEAGNAASVTIHDDLPLSAGYDVDKLPHVTPISVEHESIEVDDVSTVLEYGGTISFDEKSIAFKGGSDEFKNTKQAVKALAKVTEYLKKNPSQCILLVGTTAGVFNRRKYALDLSEKRVIAVRDCLVKQGVSPDQIETIGVGYESKFYIDDHLPDGNLDEKIASLNRTVKVLLADSPDAIALKEAV